MRDFAARLRGVYLRFRFGTEFKVVYVRAGTTLAVVYVVYVECSLIYLTLLCTGVYRCVPVCTGVYVFTVYSMLFIIN